MPKNAVCGPTESPHRGPQIKNASSSISAIIVNYCTKDLLRDCLVSLGESRVSGLEVIVVDNHSTDGSAEKVRGEFPDVRVMKIWAFRGPIIKESKRPAENTFCF